MVFGRMNPFGRSSQGESEAEDTQSEDKAQDVGETQDPSDSERPEIADKVRFWEEQDRINRELIPRVLKQNELLSAHVASHEEVRVQAASLMSSMDALAESHKREMAELEARTSEQIRSSMNSRIDEMTERHKMEMAELEVRTSKRIRSSTRRALLASIAGAGIATLAVVLALMALT